MSTSVIRLEAGLSQASAWLQVVALFPFLAVDRFSRVQRALAAAARVPWLMAALGAAFGWLPARFVRWVPRRLAGAR